MGKTALLFPGQGAQKVGMGRDFYESRPASRKVFDHARQVLGWDIANLCFEGPQNELDKTARSQPAMLTVSVAILRAMAEEMPEVAARVEAAAGLSLGEYSALVAAGAIDFDDALRLVERRGQYMEVSCREKPGGMMCVLGLNPDQVRAICAESNGEAVAANFNSPGQVVVSGSEAALDKVAALAKERGAKRSIRLPVEGAFHSPHMASAGAKLAEDLKKVQFKPARFVVVANVTANYVSMPEEIKPCLAAQVTSSVLWQQSMERLVADGFDAFYEVGEGEVLTGLMRRIVAATPITATAKIASISTVEALQKVKAQRV